MEWYGMDFMVSLLTLSLNNMEGRGREFDTCP